MIPIIKAKGILPSLLYGKPSSSIVKNEVMKDSGSYNCFSLQSLCNAFQMNLQIRPRPL